MGAQKKLEKAVYVTTILEKSQHELLKFMAYKKRRPMSALIREALASYLGEGSTSASVSLAALRGVGKEIWKEDAQKYVKKLRMEWKD